jgi:hypothetical protein
VQTMTTPTPTSEPQVLADPHGLIPSGEPLATVPELARMLGCSGGALKGLLGGPLHKVVRFVRFKPGPCRYSVADVRAAVEPHRGKIEERRQRAADLETRDRAAKAARDAARPAPRVGGASKPWPDKRPT